MSRSIIIESPKGSAAENQFAEIEDGQRALRVYTVNGGGGGGGSTQYAEDSAHASGDTGTVALVVRNDTPGSLCSADGDYAVLQVDADGALRVTIDNSSVPVTATQSGAWTVAATQSGAWTVTIQEPLSIDDGGGSITVDGTVAATQSGAWTVTVVDGGGSLTVDGTVAATQSGTWTVQLDVEVAGDSASGSTDSLLPVAAVRDDALTTLVPVDGDYTQLRTNNRGALWVKPDGNVTISNPAEDSVVVLNDKVYPVGLIRTDTLSTVSTTNGRWTNGRTNNRGAMWVAIDGTVTVDTQGPTIMELSGSTNGRPIQVTGTATGSAVTIHNPGSGNEDVVYLWATNTSGSTVTLTIEWGTTGVGNELDFVIPPNETVPILEGIYIEGVQSIEAYADTGSVVNIVGRVERAA